MSDIVKASEDWRTKSRNRPVRTKSVACKRTLFLEKFMGLENISYIEAAEIVGKSPAAVCSCFRAETDDVRLSAAHQIVESRGYRLYISLVRPGDEDSLSYFGTDVDAYVLADGKFVPKRTSFISAALNRYKIAKTKLYEQMNISNSAFRLWFIKDDIYISRVFEIAQICGFDLNIKIYPADRSVRMRVPSNNISIAIEDSYPYSVSEVRSVNKITK